ncbi:hypothetical protein N6H14_15450 [Paenibacillus sp. CC-CFT747]|nr:hypothetical protein N6H14_15450 [Paenibacillus sp. CC-CFT747]
MLSKLSLKYKIILPVMLVVTVVIAGMALILYRMTEESLLRKGASTAEVVRMSVENAMLARKTAEEVMEKEMLGQATLVSYLTEKKIGYEDLTALSRKAGIDELWISDDKGKVVLTNAGPQVDFSFAADPKGQAYAFMDLITGKRSSVAQGRRSAAWTGRCTSTPGSEAGHPLRRVSSKSAERREADEARERDRRQAADRPDEEPAGSGCAALGGGGSGWNRPLRQRGFLEGTG